MGKKPTYFGKHFDKLKDVNSVYSEKIIVDAETKNEYEAGKLILINKDLHWTSFDVVRKIRGALQIKKVGHAGTLDPLATGMLIVCTGKFTKKINEYMSQEKEYTGTFTLGAVTPTYDAESAPERVKDYSFVNDALLEQFTAQFIGHIQQLPPIYSAIKKDGVALYDLARRGDEIKLEPRNIYIRSFEITKTELPLVHFKVICGTGTYIRSLAHDYGAALGCGAYLSSLCRTRIGEFKIEEAVKLDAFLLSVKKEVKSEN
ncbi:MAG: tRNA pseudouridine(55) synthase TruB [Ferruginibacter sp.]